MRDLRNFGAQQAALMVVDRRSREVLAAIPAVPRGPGAALDFLATQRSPGSTEKPFLYALAMDRGTLTPDELLYDLPGLAPGIANADHAFLGPILPREALANSRNVPAAVLLRRMGLDAGFEYLRTLGLHDLDGPPIRFGLGMAIGAVPTTLERLVRAYAALANDGQWRELSWLYSDAGSPPRPVISLASARTVTRFLSDPMARLPTFPRYGSSEYPLAVAVKTGTSQGYRDAWTVAWSDKLLVGAWVGRPDDSPMARVSGSRAAARLVQAVLLDLHQLNRADLVAGDFLPPPAGHEPHAEAYGQAARLAIISPSPDTDVWRNPETPDALNRLVLRASVSPAVPQVTWMVDGEPAATGSPEAPFYWPMVAGRHRFQIRLPLEPGESAPVVVTVK
jgi:penicillin-binding protein 1C